MNWQNNSPKELLSVLRNRYGVSFKDDGSFFWSPATQTIHYNPNKLERHDGMWSLIHEVAHAKLQHQTYNSDFDLVQLEVAAWEEAKSIAAIFKIDIDEEYIQDCLDTYRDWLHRRSTCPTCGTVGLQADIKNYRCHNCISTWSVSAARFCRTYRRKAPPTVPTPNQETKPRANPITFQ